MAQQDRRVRRTRRILNEALIALIVEKGYSKITVQDILDRADVGRSTFYATSVTGRPCSSPASTTFATSCDRRSTR